MNINSSLNPQHEEQEEPEVEAEKCNICFSQAVSMALFVLH